MVLWGIKSQRRQDTLRKNEWDVTAMGARPKKVRGVPTPEERIDIMRLGVSGGYASEIAAVRLITKHSLPAQMAAKAVGLSVPYISESKSRLLLTPGGFGVADASDRSEATVMHAIIKYVDQFIELLPDERTFDIILGVDSANGSIQDAYYIPQKATVSSACFRVWKAYPRTDEQARLFTKGRPCQNRLVGRPDTGIFMLICHDIASFAGRSKANRGPQKATWARMLQTELTNPGDAYVVHLIHYLDKTSQGKVFDNAMSNLVSVGVKGGVSSFKTLLDPRVYRHDLEVVRERTARFAGPTIDLYLELIS